MRNLIDTGRSGRRTNKLKEKYRSRFKDGVPRSGSRKIHRFRRNRQYQAKEFTTFILWLAIGLMLAPLARSLWHVAHNHLTDRPLLLQLSLPGIAAAASVFCILRARASWRELSELRAEKAELMREMLRELDETEPSDPA